jgi:hypothetical protein
MGDEMKKKKAVVVVPFDPFFTTKPPIDCYHPDGALTCARCKAPEETTISKSPHKPVSAD